MTKTIKFAGVVGAGHEIHVVSVYGPSPTAVIYSDVLAAFPNTKEGQIEAEFFASKIGFERGEWDVEDEFSMA